MNPPFECNICGSKKGRELRRISGPDRFERASGIGRNGYSRKWWECLACGVAVNCMTPDSREVVSKLGTAYYDIDLDGPGAIAKKYDRVMGLPDAQSDNAGRTHRILEFLKAKDDPSRKFSILDIGTGMGVFLSKILRESPKHLANPVACIGIEPDPQAFAFIEQKRLFPVVRGLFPQTIREDHFDIITLNKVLEHIPGPLQILQDIHRFLRLSHGALYVEVPCITNATIKDEMDNALQSIHYNLYSVNSLSRLLSRAGLMVVKAERIYEPSGKISVYAFAVSESDPAGSFL